MFSVTDAAFFPGSRPPAAMILFIESIMCNHFVSRSAVYVYIYIYVCVCVCVCVCVHTYMVEINNFFMTLYMTSSKHLGRYSKKEALRTTSLCPVCKSLLCLQVVVNSGPRRWSWYQGSGADIGSVRSRQSDMLTAAWLARLNPLAP
jgi:hypothetical protein